MNHDFIFSSGEWLGEGTIKLSMSEEPLHFVTKWKPQGPPTDGIIEIAQEVQIKGMSEVMVNLFSISLENSQTFLIALENDTVGRVEGSGVINNQVIGWEFNNPEVNFQGFEFYEKQQDDVYLLRGEYASDDDYRTHITGKIWKKTKK